MCEVLACEEARRFIAAAKELEPQSAAFYTLTLDSGARKGELCGLKWTDINLDAAAVAIVRQLIKPGSEPLFGPLKNGESRTISIAPETMALLRKHKAHQAELNLANRTHYMTMASCLPRSGSTCNTTAIPWGIRCR
jgi:integrase